MWSSWCIGFYKLTMFYSSMPGYYGKLIDDKFDLEFTTNASGYADMPRNPFADGPIVNTYASPTV